MPKNPPEPREESFNQNCDEDSDGGVPQPVMLDITDVLDLHPFRPRDVREVVAAYLEEARAKGFTTVRIVHGKGIGAQRELVRAILSQTNFVATFQDAPAEAGGWGATVAWLRNTGG